MTVLPPLQGLSVLGVDFEPGHKVQADNEQIRHHHTSDYEHTAVASELSAPHG